MSIELIENGILQALILSLIALGVMIPFRILSFADLTSEGSYPLGGAIAASLIIAGIHPILATIIAVILAGIIGIATALINLRLKVNSLLAGIIVSTICYSINLRAMGKPNIALFESHTLFTIDDTKIKILILSLILSVILIALKLFLGTEKGLVFRAVGLNKEFIERQGISITKYTILGLFLGNAFAGLGGSLIVQIQNYADIGMGNGIVIHALAALMLGECILQKQSLLAPIVGAIFYQQIQGIALSLGLAPSDLKMLTALIVLCVIAIQKKEKREL